MAGLAQLIFLLAVFSQVPGPGLGVCPPEVKEFESGVSKQEASQIVKHMNSLRKALSKGQIEGQPKALKLKKLKYSTELAEIAQARVDTCQPGLYPEILNATRLGVIQKLRKSMNEAPAGADWKNTIDYWFAMNIFYEYPTAKKKKASYYMHIANAGATKVGCGYKNYRDAKYKMFSFTKAHICVFDSYIDTDTPPYSTRKNP